MNDEERVESLLAGLVPPGPPAGLEARVLRAGKSLAFGEIDLRGARDGQSVCRASTTYALL